MMLPATAAATTPAAQAQGPAAAPATKHHGRTGRFSAAERRILFSLIWDDDQVLSAFCHQQRKQNIQGKSFMHLITDRFNEKTKKARSHDAVRHHLKLRRSNLGPLLERSPLATPIERDFRMLEKLLEHRWVCSSRESCTRCLQMHRLRVQRGLAQCGHAHCIVCDLALPSVREDFDARELLFEVRRRFYGAAATPSSTDHGMDPLSACAGGALTYPVPRGRQQPTKSCFYFPAAFPEQSAEPEQHSPTTRLGHSSAALAHLLGYPHDNDIHNQPHRQHRQHQHYHQHQHPTQARQARQASPPPPPPPPPPLPRRHDNEPSPHAAASPSEPYEPRHRLYSADTKRHFSPPPSPVSTVVGFSVEDWFSSSSASTPHGHHKRAYPEVDEYNRAAPSAKLARLA